MSRDAKEGVILLSGDDNKSSLIEVNCETDFVAKNEDFIQFVKELSELNNQCSSDLEKLNKIKMINNKTVEENIIALIAKIGEKITIGKAKTIENVNSRNFSYQHSIIKDNVFIGSNSSLVAPITINEKSTVGAGSVITKNVNKKSLALTRSDQIEIKNYKRKK